MPEKAIEWFKLIRLWHVLALLGFITGLVPFVSGSAFGFTLTHTEDVFAKILCGCCLVGAIIINRLGRQYALRVREMDLELRKDLLDHGADPDSDRTRLRD